MSSSRAETAPEPTVFVVEDDPSSAQLIAELVGTLGLKAETYNSAGSFLAAYKPVGPGCLVLDVRLPDMSGLELLEKLAGVAVALPAIVMSAYGDVPMAVDAMKLGAAHFLGKPFRGQDLCDQVQHALRRAAADWQQHQQRQRAEQLLSSLTTAEREAFDLVVAGNTNRMIAEQLGLSIRAVEDRRARMMKKLGATARTDLLDLAARSSSG